MAGDDDRVVHVSAAGTELWRSASLFSFYSISVNPTDGSCWAVDYYYGQAAHLSAIGTELSRSAYGAFYEPTCISVNPLDNSCWVADSGNSLIVKLALAPAPPHAEFSGWPTSGVAPLYVQFNDRSTNAPTAWSWDFGDGGNSTAENPSHLYSTGGRFTVALTAASALGSNTSTKTNYLIFTAAPVASFSGTPTSGLAPLTVQFTDLSSNAPTSWTWSFGDGCSDTTQNPSHVYESWGSFSVSLTAKNPIGSNTCVKAAFLTVTRPGHWLSVSAASSQYLVDPNGSTSLSASAVDSEGHDVAFWSWSDGGAGGTFSDPTAQNPTYTAPTVAPNTTRAIPLTVTATCNGATPVSGDAAAPILVRGAQISTHQGVVQLWQGETSGSPWYLSANSADGSCWVADGGTQQVVHLDANGVELWRSAPFTHLVGIAVNPADGSCWVADRLTMGYPGQVAMVHLAHDGTELWRGGDLMLSARTSLSVNPTDGSCWVTGCCSNQLFRFASDDSETAEGRWIDSVAVNPADGSFWTYDPSANQIVHFSRNGVKLWSGADYDYVYQLAVSPSDGSCWALALASWTGTDYALIHVAATGPVLSTDGSFVSPTGLSVNPADGSVWVSDLGTLDDPSAANPKGEVIYLDAFGVEQWRGGGFVAPFSVSVTAADGSCWVADSGVYDSVTKTWPGAKVVHFAVQTAPLPNHTLTVSAAAESYQVASGGSTVLTASAADSDGHQAASWAWSDGGAGGSFSDPAAENPTYTAPDLGAASFQAVALTVTATCDGPSPVTGTGATLLTVVRPQGAASASAVNVWQGMDFSSPGSVSVNPVDGSCWVADWGSEQVIHLAADGTEVWRSGHLNGLSQAVVSPADGSCWILVKPSTTTAEIIHLARDGSELWRGVTFNSHASVRLNVNPVDGSAWAAASIPCNGSEMVHIAADGRVLLRQSTIGPGLVVNPVDGSLWIGDCKKGQEVHLSSEGVEIGRVTSLTNALAVNPTDGSLWMAGCTVSGDGPAHNHIIRLTGGGTLVSSLSGFANVLGLSVNPADGSCWVASFGSCYSGGVTGPGALALVAADGTVLWRTDSTDHPASVSVNPTDGSCWVAEEGIYDSTSDTYSQGKVLHLGLLSLNALASASPTAVDSGGTTSLSASAVDGVGEPITWSWSDGGAGGGFSDVTAPNPTYTAPANFTGADTIITLSVTAACAGTYPLSSTVMIPITLRHFPAPETDFSGAPLSGSVPLTVYFADTSAEAPTAWAWTFGDGATSTEQNPSHTYTSGGAFTVSLAVTNAGGADTKTKNDYVTATDVQAAIFSDDFESAFSGWTLTGTPDWYTGTPKNGTHSVQFLGASGSGIDEGIERTISTVGYRDITVSFYLGGKSLDSSSEYIVAEWWDGSAWTELTRVAGVIGSTATWNSYTSATLPAGASNNPNFKLRFSLYASGTGDYGYVDDVVVSGVVGSANLVANFTGNPTSGSAPKMVSFTDTSTGFPTSWSWSFGDGGTSTEEDPSHTYASAGIYSVSEMVSAASGSDSRTKQDYVTVTFTDVAPDFWAAQQILACMEAGIVSGYADGSYGPSLVVNRGQMAVFVARALAGGDSSVPAGPATAHFSDVPTNYWAFKYVEYAYSQNIVGGYADGSYGPETNVDRGQMAVFIARSIVTPTGDAGLVSFTPPATPSFPDVPTSFWSFKHVEYLKQAKVVGGYADGDYHPEYGVTRDQMAVFVARAFQLLQ